MLHKLSRYLKSAFILILLLSSTVVLSGCWGHNELSELGLVLATAIDQLEDGDYQITVMAVVPTGGAMQQTEKSNVWIGSAIGDSIMDASKNLRKTATKKLSWLQNDVMIIGERAARNGIDDIVDFNLRNRELRLSNRLIISEGKASEIFNIPAGIEKNLYSEIKGMIDNTREWSKGYVPEFNDFMSSYTNKYSGKVAGRISYVASNMKTVSTHRESELRKEPATAENKIALMSGSSVFRKDKLIDFMNDDETRGYLWVVGEVRTGAVVATEPKGTQKITMEAHSIQSKIIPNFEGGKPSATIKVKLEGTLVENTSKLDLLEEKNVKAIERQFAEQIKNEMRITVKKAQKDYKLDIFGISNAFYRHKPSAWREIKEGWEEIFPDMEIKYEVKVVLSNIGEIQKRVIGGEED